MMDPLESNATTCPSTKQQITATKTGTQTSMIYILFSINKIIH